MRLRSQAGLSFALLFVIGLPAQREYTALLAKSLRAPREQYLFRDATARQRNKRGRTPTICLRETLSRRCGRQFIVSRRNVLLVSTSTSLHHQTPLPFILSPFRSVGRHFCSRRARIDVTVYLFYSNDGNRSGHRPLEYS